VTLIEMLIAITLVTLVSVGILTAMRLGLSALERTNTKLMDNRRVFGAQRILQQQLAGFMPVSAVCATAPGQPPQGEVRFFQGETESMRFVSSYSIQESARGRPQVLEYQVIPGENGRGVRLIVNEWPYAGPASAGLACLGVIPDPVLHVLSLRFRPIESGPGSFVLADKLAYCHFLYRDVPQPPKPETWTPRWVRMDEWPSAVRIDLAPLVPDPSRPQVLPVTVPLRASRDPIKIYAEQQQ
jgi:hypothetical protein